MYMYSLCTSLVETYTLSIKWLSIIILLLRGCVAFRYRYTSCIRVHCTCSWVDSGMLPQQINVPTSGLDGIKCAVSGTAIVVATKFSEDIFICSSKDNYYHGWQRQSSPLRFRKSRTIAEAVVAWERHRPRAIKVGEKAPNSLADPVRAEKQNRGELANSVAAGREPVVTKRLQLLAHPCVHGLPGPSDGQVCDSWR